MEQGSRVSGGKASRKGGLWERACERHLPLWSASIARDARWISAYVKIPVETTS